MGSVKLLFLIVALLAISVLCGTVFATVNSSQASLVIATTQDPGSWDPIA